jgi:hypothetical protein
LEPIIWGVRPEINLNFEKRKFSKRKIIKKAYLNHAGLVFVFLVQSFNESPKIIEFLEFWSDYFAVGDQGLFHLSFRVIKKRRRYQILGIRRANNRFDGEGMWYVVIW